MKQLKCEMCGSTDLIKQDGVFVCQNCGCKYSVEEAKKMMIEGIVSVQIDNSSMVDNWFKMGRLAYEAGNYKEAYEYYTKIIEQEPDNWRAILEKGKSAAWQSTLGNLRLNELYSNIKTVLSIIEEKLSYDEKVKIKNECCLAIVDVNNAITDLMEKSIPENSDGRWPSHEKIIIDSLRRHLINVNQLRDAMPLIESIDDNISQSNIIQIKMRCCRDIKHSSYNYCCNKDYSGNNITYCHLERDEIVSYEDLFAEYVVDIRKTIPNYGKSIKELPAYYYYFNSNDECLAYWEEKFARKNDDNKRIEKMVHLSLYWQNHADEKSRLDSKLSESKSKQDNLKKEQHSLELQISFIEQESSKPCESEAEYNILTKKEQSLITERQSLGLFSGKRKKEIQAELDSLSREKVRIGSILQAQKNEKGKKHLSNDVQIKEIKKKISQLAKEINSLQVEIDSIQTELTRDR